MADVSYVSSIQSYYSGDYGDTAVKNEDFGKGDFFKLISAQLKYQNPLAPMDDVDFMGQTAQFNILEQIADLNNRIQCLMYSQDSLYASSLIGKEVTWVDDNLEIREGMVERVTFSKDGLQLIIDGMVVDLNSMISISEAPEEGSTE